MRAIIKVPGRDPALIDIDNTLHRLQMIVDGYIETYTIAEDVAIVCNEEGKLRGLPYNCTLCGEHFVGTILFVGVDGDEFTDVPEELFRVMKDGFFEEVEA